MAFQTELFSLLDLIAAGLLCRFFVVVVLLLFFVCFVFNFVLQYLRSYAVWITDIINYMWSTLALS